MPSTVLTFTTNTALSGVDDARLSRVEAALPTSRYGAQIASPSAYATPAATAVQANGQISPTTGVAAVGNTFTFVVQGKFGYSWDGTLLHLYWDGTNGSTPFTVLRADGSKQSVPSGSLTIAGLAASTSFGFAPFIATAQPSRVSFAVGDSGSPLYAISPGAKPDLLTTASQTQRATSNERLSDGLIYFPTGTATAPSTGGGTAAPASPYTGT
jgi:hypothetical protein